MLREITPTPQISDEPLRKWFTDDAMDLIVWFAPGGDVMGFQLCYSKGTDEHALTWWNKRGFSHDRIDDGEGRPDSQKMAPVLVPDGSFDSEGLIAQFRKESGEIDARLAAFITETIAGYPLVHARNANVMNRVLRFPSAVRHDPRIDAWMRDQGGELGAIAQRWFDVMRKCGEDVRELLHDGHPTACVADAAFAYVNAFRAHVNVGFFRGAEIADPEGLLEGTGRFMRHVKLRPERGVEARALLELIETAYTDMRERLTTE